MFPDQQNVVNHAVFLRVVQGIDLETLAEPRGKLVFLVMAEWKAATAWFQGVILTLHVRR
jgi:hypothetical protein